MELEIARQDKVRVFRNKAGNIAILSECFYLGEQIVELTDHSAKLVIKAIQAIIDEEEE